MRILIVVALVAACGATPERTVCPQCPATVVATAAAKEPAASPPTGATEVAGAVMADLQTGDAARLHARFDAQMKTLVPLERLRIMLTELPKARGRVTGIEPIKVSAREGSFKLITEQGAWQMDLALDESGQISGLLLKEPPSAAPPVARAAVISLPFRGTWKVFWGGDTADLNYHVATANQRRAADLIIVGVDGKSHTGDGSRNQDYLAYGKDILAVSAGRVVVVVDGVPDNKPGEMNAMMATGNTVVIEHAPGLYSMTAHFIPGSIKVKIGQKVRAGQLLGKCGNSGNSSEPHIHFQLQDGASLTSSFGIEPVFSAAEVTRDGTTTRQTEYTWRKGDLVSSPTMSRVWDAPRPKGD
ncbi:MAG: peptidoglycan DD-metalloendopeptidase family protein [Deltaproteobacteria bacterium]|nr:peptidoglycan DD-metalloendopeptidase family protein [Deltaproteobacteria bacterium]